MQLKLYEEVLKDNDVPPAVKSKKGENPLWMLQRRMTPRAADLHEILFDNIQVLKSCSTRKVLIAIDQWNALYKSNGPILGHYNAL